MLANRAGAYGNGKKDYARAIEDLSEAIRLDPQPRYLGYRSGYYELIGKPELSLPDLDRLIRLEPTNFVAFQSRCWVNALLGRLDQALADCNKSIELASNVANTLDSRGLVYLKMKQYDKAIADFNAALKAAGYVEDGAVGPSLAGSLYGRGIARLRSGDALGGATDMAAAKAAKPDVIEDYTRYGI